MTDSNIRGPMRLYAALSATVIALSAGAAHAAERATYPTKPIRVIVGFAPGGSADITARTVGQKISEILGQPVVVDNRAGASGIIGCEGVARSAPDGYTLLMGTTGTHTTNPAVFSKLPYDPLKCLPIVRTLHRRRRTS